MGGRPRVQGEQGSEGKARLGADHSPINRSQSNAHRHVVPVCDILRDLKESNVNMRSS